jgi:hypothetical protein
MEGASESVTASPDQPLNDGLAWTGGSLLRLARNPQPTKNREMMYSTIKVRERHPRPHHEGAIRQRGLTFGVLAFPDSART